MGRTQVRQALTTVRFRVDLDIPRLPINAWNWTKSRLTRLPAMFQPSRKFTSLRLRRRTFRER
jgi:hypothetical protein